MVALGIFYRTMKLQTPTCELNNSGISNLKKWKGWGGWIVSYQTPGGDSITGLYLSTPLTEYPVVCLTLKCQEDILNAYLGRRVEKLICRLKMDASITFLQMRAKFGREKRKRNPTESRQLRRLCGPQKFRWLKSDFWKEDDRDSGSWFAGPK